MTTAYRYGADGIETDDEWSGDIGYGIYDKYGNPRAVLEIRNWSDLPGDTVSIKIQVDDTTPEIVQLHTGSPVAGTVVKQSGFRQLVHIPKHTLQPRVRP
ncbi:MAG TPA: hypothetical protein VND54_07710 [Candidatus Saccharimonadales bacterium]|nr:hypothetical protein [Candidatus Saccharimonadales bacterium]